MSGKTWGIARTRGHCNGWTIEAIRSGSSDWWIKVYSAFSGDEIPNLFTRYPSIAKAHAAANKIARQHPAPESTR